MNVLTTIHDVPPQKEQQGTVSGLLKTGKSIEFPCPDALTACNRYMGGVDKNDPLQSYYEIGVAKEMATKTFLQLTW